MSESAAAPHARLIDHVAVITHDADRTVAWYAQHLGLIPTHDEYVEAAGVRLAWLYPTAVEAGGEAAALQILQPLRPGPAMTHLQQRGEGLHHICFAVEDLEKSLLAAGQSPDDAFVGGYGLPCAFLEPGPGSTVIELVQRPVPAV
ncbi:VOC family protein [Streptomyces sp. CWNU-52B]|uniref:VOC family protein n=1 Tax=unclassified Streptomyces TaxID=2593676 RepID=UPI0039C10A14